MLLRNNNNLIKPRTMKQEILERGRVTHAITDDNGNIYGCIDGYIDLHYQLTIGAASHYYWSEVYVEGKGYNMHVIRKGTLLVDPTKEELDNYFKQSKVNIRGEE